MEGASVCIVSTGSNGSINLLQTKQIFFLKNTSLMHHRRYDNLQRTSKATVINHLRVG